jgi:peptidoglycan/xylan/chitin deacetylase (PgdA/CDA1 family)
VKPRLPVLTFHSIDEQPSVISFRSELFNVGLSLLRDSGHRSLELCDGLERLRNGDLPQRSFCITFDDGYQSVHREAFPALQNLGLTATVFLTVGERGTGRLSDPLPELNGRAMLTWREIREMHESGTFTFGAHTLTHPDLTRVTAGRAEIEIRESQQIIEDVLGVPVTSFAYPFGRFDERSRDIAGRHFQCACSDRLGLVTSTSDPFAFERVDAYYLRRERLFRLMLRRYFPAYVWARNVPRTLKRGLVRA